MRLKYLFPNHQYPPELHFILKQMHAELLFVADKTKGQGKFDDFESQANDYIYQFIQSKTLINEDALHYDASVEAYFQQTITNKQQSKIGLALIDKEKRVILGFLSVCISFSRQEFYIELLASYGRELAQHTASAAEDDNYRRKFTGSVLLCALSYFLSGNRCVSSFAHTWNIAVDSLPGAVEFYTKMGFEVQAFGLVTSTPLAKLRDKTAAYLRLRLNKITVLQRNFKSYLLTSSLSL